MATEEMIVPASPAVRAKAFLADFTSADNDADIEIRIGRSDIGPCVQVAINKTKHAFTAAEARIVANIMEEALRAYPEAPDAETLPNMIMALRHGAQEAEKA